MSQKIGVGIIGTGSISRAHIEGYLAFPDDCRIVAVADMVGEKAKHAAASIGPDVAWTDDYHELLSRDDIHLVSVCTPPFVHASISIDALNAKKHVLVEKPMAASLADADAMIQAAEQNDRWLSVVFQYRYRHDWWLAKQIVDQGLLGDLHFGKAECLWWRGTNYYKAWWRGTWEQECGGATINHAVHHIDMLLWLMGPVESVNAEMATVQHNIEVEDLSIAIVKFASGALGSITGTVTDHHNLDRIEVTGSRAAISLPHSVRAFEQYDNGFGYENKEMIEKINEFAKTVTLPSHSGHAPQIQDVLDAIKSGRPPMIDGHEGRRSLELITALYKSASTGSRVTLPLSPDDPFYTTEGLRANVKRHERRSENEEAS